ncbi:MAG: type II toxin-antitoxin system VapB family antitoxin [Geminicoccales bacterium]
MRTTVTIDDDLLEKAEALTQIKERRALIREALQVLIERESARRLAKLGGTQPDLKAPPRRLSSTPEA